MTRLWPAERVCPLSQSQRLLCAASPLGGVRACVVGCPHAGQRALSRACAIALCVHAPILLAHGMVPRLRSSRLECACARGSGNTIPRVVQRVGRARRCVAKDTVCWSARRLLYTTRSPLRRPRTRACGLWDARSEVRAASAPVMLSTTAGCGADIASAETSEDITASRAARRK